MSVPSWADLEALFHEALARGPAERAAFLAERCAGRLELRAEVEALLARARSHSELPRGAADGTEDPVESRSSPRTVRSAG